MSNITLVLERGAAISGRVTGDDGSPLGNVDVSASTTNTGTMLFNARPFFARTDDDGRYVANGLPPGTYSIRTSAQSSNCLDEWYDDVMDQGHGCPTNALGIELLAGMTVSNVNFSLRKGAAITGKVTGDNGLPRPNVTIFACYTNENVAQSGWTGSDGTYQLVGLHSGVYYVRTLCGEAPTLDQWYRNQPASESGIPTSAIPVCAVEEATISNIDFTLAAGGSISGHVRSETGAAIPSAHIVIDTPWSLDAPVYTDQNGAYAVSGFTSGVYSVATDTKELGLVDQNSNVAVTVGMVTVNVDFNLARTAPQIESCKMSDALLKFSWNGLPYVGYQIEYTTNLCQPWTNAPSGASEMRKNLRSVASPRELEYEIPESTNAPMFFRLRLIED